MQMMLGAFFTLALIGYTTTEQSSLGTLISWGLLLPQYAYIYYCITLLSYTTHGSLLNVHTVYLDVVGIFWILLSASVLCNAAFTLIKIVINDPSKSYGKLVYYGILVYGLVHHGQTQTASWNPFAAKDLIRDISNVPTFLRDVESNVCSHFGRVAGEPGLLLTRLGTGCATRATFGIK